MASTEFPNSSWQRPVALASKLVIALVLVLTLSWGKPVLVPIAIATLLTFLLNPIVRKLQSFGMGRLSSVILAVTTVGILVCSLAAIGSREITTLLGELPANTAKIRDKVRTLKAGITGPTAMAFEEMIEEIGREIKSPPRTVVEESVDSGEELDSKPTVIQTVEPNSERSWMLLTGYIGSAAEAMAMFAFALILLVFFLLEREGLRDRIVLLAGRSRLTLTSKALEDATKRVSRYIGMVALVNGGFGVLLTIGLFALGVPYAILWGCVAALLRFIPYIGPWVGAFFPIAMSLALSEGWWQPISVFAFVMTLELVANNVVEPIVFGHTTGVTPAALLISAAFWLYLWGPIGLILSAPFAVCLVVLGKNIPQLDFLNVLLGDEPVLSADAGFYQRLLVRDQQEASALIVQQMANADSDQVFDELLIPSLNSARRDLDRGHLSEAECNTLLGVLDKALSAANRFTQNADKKEESSAEATVKDLATRLTLFMCAADGKIDRTAAMMLHQMLDPSRWIIEISSEEMLTSEIAERIAKNPPAVVCIAALPPESIKHARYLCKKLRAVSVDIPIVVGRWGKQRLHGINREQLLESGASDVTTSLRETRQWLDSHYPILEQATSAEEIELTPVRPSELVSALSS